MLGAGLGSSRRIWPDQECLLVQTALDGASRIVWMIIWVIKAHPILYRMPRLAPDDHEPVTSAS
jgi:hypothetical protein